MTETLETEEGGIATVSHARILVIMAVVSVLGAVAGYFLVSGKAGFGIVAGGVLAFGNYYWMKRTLASLFEAVREGEKPGFIGGKYLLRYIAFGTLLAALYLADPSLIVPLILGMSSFAFAVVVEGFIRLLDSILFRRNP